jgi:hypothetical protein
VALVFFLLPVRFIWISEQTEMSSPYLSGFVGDAFT